MAYLLDSFLDKAFLGFEWISQNHRKVAENTLLGNSSIGNKDLLVELAKKINNIPSENIASITYGDLLVMGIPIGG